MKQVKPTIYDQFNQVFQGKQGQIFSPAEIKHEISSRFGTNKSSIIPADFCYNRINNGITFQKHIFEYRKRGMYKYLGEHYPYTGKITHRPKKQHERVVGEWDNGKILLYGDKGDL